VCLDNIEPKKQEKKKTEAVSSFLASPLYWWMTSLKDMKGKKERQKEGRSYGDAQRRRDGSLGKIGEPALLLW
jgi:hypothetical protein